MKNSIKPLSTSIDHNRQQPAAIDHNTFEHHFAHLKNGSYNFFIGESRL
ncbi:MAG: hypothetical protein HOP07_04555 [Bacteriovoracaceae bacterium]|nr:hypothetical protein [Bacteriovoracaceae bacterium]